MEEEKAVIIDRIIVMLMSLDASVLRAVERIVSTYIHSIYKREGK